MIGEENVLIGRRNLNRGESLRTEELAALPGDVRPLPFEEMNHGGAGLR
jgi:hypothetical protein